MNPRIVEDRKFKEAIGAFVIAFSELEYGLADLGSMTEFDPRKKSQYFIKHVGFPFERKVSNLTEFIDENLPELKSIWLGLKQEIGEINATRRRIAHGFIQYCLPFESTSTSTFVKNGQKLTEKKFNSTEINVYTNRIHNLNSGTNGINGEFHTLFSLTRINKWNDLVNDKSKIVYKVCDKILSDWKGK